jgi:sarcosine oxidase delta subunit
MRWVQYWEMRDYECSHYFLRRKNQFLEGPYWKYTICNLFLILKRNVSEKIMITRKVGIMQTVKSFKTKESNHASSAY